MADILEYKCPCCGGAIEFDSKLQKLKCPYCDSEFEVQSLKDMDETLKYVDADSLEWGNTQETVWNEGEDSSLRTYICNSCGGEIIADENTAASKCPYCGNPVVMTGSLSGELKPDYVIPFKLDKKAAVESLKRHLSGKRLLPKVFKDQNHIEEINGIYVPFWLFDADAEAAANFKTTRVRAWSDRNYNYTETSHYSVFRAGNLSFEHIPVDGSTKMADDLMESIEPYDYSEAVDFQTAYLAGYLADKYDVSKNQSKERANQRIKASAEAELRSTVSGYASVVPVGSSVKLSSGGAKYALLPVWILNTDWNGQKYTFAMNGQTGKFVGNLPVDNAAYFKWLALLTAAFGAGAFLLLSLFWLL